MISLYATIQLMFANFCSLYLQSYLIKYKFLWIDDLLKLLLLQAFGPCRQSPRSLAKQEVFFFNLPHIS